MGGAAGGGSARAGAGARAGACAGAHQAATGEAGAGGTAAGAVAQRACAKGVKGCERQDYGHGWVMEQKMHNKGLNDERKQYGSSNAK